MTSCERLGLGLGWLTLNGPTRAPVELELAHDQPYNVVLTVAICGGAQPPRALV